jgi:hypothetical protein
MATHAVSSIAGSAASGGADGSVALVCQPAPCSMPSFAATAAPNRARARSSGLRPRLAARARLQPHAVLPVEEMPEHHRHLRVVQYVDPPRAATYSSNYLRRLPVPLGVPVALSDVTCLAKAS